MRNIVLVAFGLMLSGCVSCISTDNKGTTTCTTYEYEDSCPVGTTEVESCDAY